MNNIRKIPIGSLGYHFIEAEYLPEGEDEYYLRNKQNRSGIAYRQLTAFEIEVLVRNRNTSDDWNKVLVSDAFNPELVKNCKFFGLIRIGKLEPFYLSFQNLRLPVGLYDSTIISCDLGDNVVISNVNYMSHYVIGNEVMISNVNELASTDYAKFGIGIIKEGELEKNRIWLEICNENGGRSVIPFNGMLPGDAYLWSRRRDDHVLLEQFKLFTEKQFDNKRGYYGKIGDRTVIKNTRIIKDVWIGSDAYIKGANKLKNITINSSPEAKSQIGEGCEMVNGIMGFGSRAFYGVKAVRFIMASNTQLKYGARLINSYLGDNATISCCEVLNSLIFPAHEQHHNNSFLCAALIMGQSNMAAGATIGSNHNSRAADGEIIAGRGFWPGLCVSLKHNSRFASYTLIAKGDYPAELTIPIPFSLLSNDTANDQLLIMPAYWFMYNMYAIMRNGGKYEDRDRRIEKEQRLEYNFLAPDTVNEMFDAIEWLEKMAGSMWYRERGKDAEPNVARRKGRQLLESKEINRIEIQPGILEHSNRNVFINKAADAYGIFKRLIRYYACNQLLEFADRENIKSWNTLSKKLPMNVKRNNWENVGGQLIPSSTLESFIGKIRQQKVQSWTEVHAFYAEQGQGYNAAVWEHAWASLCELDGIRKTSPAKKHIAALLQQGIETKEWITKNIYSSREKDYENPFRKMVYSSEEEMNEVVGAFADNSFIKEQKTELRSFKRRMKLLAAKLNLDLVANA